MKKKICFIIEILIILSLFITSIVYARGFADFDDATADAEAKNQLEEQEKQQKESIGKSNNNYLTELSIKGYSLVPTFDKQTINYEIENEIDNDTVEIIAKADDSNAKISGSGLRKLQTGENIILIEVTAENGTVRTYNIKVNKKVESTELKLASLKLVTENKDGNKEDVFLSPEFSADIYKYSCIIEDYVDEIKVDSLAISEDINIKVEGNTSLKTGKNEMLITLNSENNQYETIYKIEVEKKEGQVATKEDNKSYFLIIIVVGIIVIIIFFILIKSKTKNKNKRKH